MALEYINITRRKKPGGGAKTAVSRTNKKTTIADLIGIGKKYTEGFFQSIFKDNKKKTRKK